MKIPTSVLKIEKNAKNRSRYKISSVFKSDDFRKDLPIQKFLKCKSIVTSTNPLQTYPKAINNQNSNFYNSYLQKDEK